jgi:Leucine Rich repeat
VLRYAPLAATGIVLAIAVLATTTKSWLALSGEEPRAPRPGNNGQDNAVVPLDLSHQVLDEEALATLRKQMGVTELNLSRSTITNAGLQYIAGFRCLEELQLNGTGISDSGLKHLSSLMGLRRLGLRAYPNNPMQR